LSRLYSAKEAEGTTREFKFSDFAAPDITAPGKSGPAFVPDRVATPERAEFIAGGFDFDYKGGMRREEILRRTIDEAEEIRATAIAEAVSIREKARSQGHAEGHAAGYAEGLNKAAPVIDSFTSLVRALTSARDEFYSNSENEMVELVINVAEMALGDQIEKNPGLIRHVIKSAVLKLQSREQMTIRVNPKDIAEAEKVRQDISKEVEDIEKVSFKGDPLVSRGGCVLETNMGSIDARVETQLEAMRESLLAAVEESKIEQSGKK
jgi:flagellar assembly protein FliH